MQDTPRGNRLNSLETQGIEPILSAVHHDRKIRVQLCNDRDYYDER
jgi:hypothetical protein